MDNLHRSRVLGTVNSDRSEWWVCDRWRSAHANDVLGSTHVLLRVSWPHYIQVRTRNSIGAIGVHPWMADYQINCAEGSRVTSSMLSSLLAFNGMAKYRSVLCRSGDPQHITLHRSDVLETLSNAVADAMLTSLKAIPNAHVRLSI